MSRKILLVIFSLFILIPSSAFAQAQTTTSESTTMTTLTATPTPSTMDSMSRKNLIRNKLIEKNANSITTTAEGTSGAKTIHRSEVEKLRLAKKAAIDSAREEFVTQLAALKDEKKKDITEKINEDLITSNTTATDRMFAILDKLEEILTRVETKINDAKTGGTEISAQETEIANAKAALQAAIDAVTEQAAKDYVITIGTDATLRNDVGTVVSQQKLDLKTTYETVRSAKQAIRQAAKSLKSLNTMSTMPYQSSTSGASESGVVNQPVNSIQ